MTGEPAVVPATLGVGWGSRLHLFSALGIGTLALVLAVRQVDWRSVAGAVAHVSIGWLVLAALGSVALHLLVAIRWRVLVNVGAQLSLGDAFDFVVIGALAGIASSARLGDVARVIAAGRYRSLSPSRLLGTILVERLFDVIMLLGFGVGLAFLMAIPALVQGALAVLFVAAVALAIVLWMGQAGPLGIASQWIARLTGRTSRTFAVFTRFVGGVGVVREQGRAAQALAVALLIWFGAAATTSCSLAAFGISAPWYAGAFAVVVISLAGIIPAPPGGIGVYDYLAMMALSPWVADPSTAFAFALVTHALSIGVIVALGSVSLLRKNLPVEGPRLWR